MATGLLNTTGNNSFTPAQIREFISQPGRTDAEVYQRALETGVSAAQLSAAMPNNPGYSAANINNYVATQQPGYTAPVATPSTQISQWFAGNPNASDADVYTAARGNGITAADLAANAPASRGYTPDNVSAYYKTQEDNSGIRSAIDANVGYKTGPAKEKSIFDYIKSNNLDPARVGSMYGVNPADSLQFMQRGQSLADAATIAPTFASAPVPYSQATFTPAIQDQASGTVAGQLNKNQDQNSPLMQRAATYGLQQANARGLLDSSIAISAAQSAMIDAGLQIALPDAASSNQFSLSNAQTRNQQNQFNAELGQKGSMFNTEQLNKFAITNLDNANQRTLANIQGQYNLDIQTSTNSSQLFDTTMKTIFEIGGKDWTASKKQAETDKMLQMLQNGLAINRSTSSLNLNFSSVGRGAGSAPVNPGSSFTGEIGSMIKGSRDQARTALEGGLTFTGNGWQRLGGAPNQGMISRNLDAMGL